jgi:ABC-type multidrug transport system fused ATPase/permease subunit
MILISKAVPSIVLCFGQVGLIVVALAMFSSGASTADLLPQLTLIVVIVARILPATAGLSGSTTKLVKAVPYCEGLRKALAELDALSQTTNEKARPDIAAWQTLALEHVGFRHASADRDQLTDVTIAFGRGRRFGIVGPSGAGKSTLVDLILRLIEPTSGRILVDGKTFADFNRESWMSRIGYVAQEVPIIDDTVRRNVAFGVADRQIDDSRIWRALERAGLSDEVRRLSMGLAAPVGDMGGRMSGGQRQRLAIARALYFEPDILLLDEATSGLDPATEAAVLQNLLGLKEDLTLIMVTHRLPTTAICDEVFVLAEGRLAASGTYAQLLANPEIAALLSGAVVGDAAAKADSLY